MSVYFIKGKNDNSKVKIGYSKNVKNRLKQIQYMSPVELEILNTMDGNAQVEMNIHQMFNSVRLYGEWFRLTPELAEFIKSPFNPTNQGRNGNFHIIRSPVHKLERDIMKSLYSENGSLPVCKKCNGTFLVIERREYMEDQWEHELYIDGDNPKYCPLCGCEIECIVKDA